jgi:carbonic anhydrase
METEEDSSQTAVVISCSDSRLESTMSRLRLFLHQNPLLSVTPESYFYRIQVPGPDGTLLGQRGEDHKQVLLDDIRMLISTSGASAIIFIPHCDCAGCRVSDETHELNCTKVEKILHSEFDLPVLTLLDHPDNDGLKDWHFELVGNPQLLAAH